jgi:hypothetical protein
VSDGECQMLRLSASEVTVCFDNSGYFLF